MTVYKTGTVLKLGVMRVHIYENRGCPPTNKQSTKTVTVLSSDERATVVRIKGMRNPERAIAQLTDEHLLIGFGATGRPVKYEVHAVREHDPARYPCAVFVEYPAPRYNLMNNTRTVCRIVDSRSVLDECRAFTARAQTFQIGCNGWTWGTA